MISCEVLYGTDVLPRCVTIGTKIVCLFVFDVHVCLFYLNKVCNEEDKSCSVCKAVQKETSPQQVSGGCSLHVFLSDISYDLVYIVYGDTYLMSLYT